MAEVNTLILVQSWLRRARQQDDPAAWLLEINSRAVDALATGAVFVTALSMEGSSSSQQQKYNPEQLAQVTELALQRLEAETAAGGAANLPAVGAVRYGSFGPNYAQTLDRR